MKKILRWIVPIVFVVCCLFSFCFTAVQSNVTLCYARKHCMLDYVVYHKKMKLGYCFALIKLFYSCAIFF